MTTTLLALKYVSTCIGLLACLAFFSAEADQAGNLQRLLKSRSSSNPPRPDLWSELESSRVKSDIYINTNQDGLMETDKILKLPGQPADGVNFVHYSGYVTVDPKAGKSLFYYFAESPKASSSLPLVLWLNGGPGCSSFGYGAMQELGPFRVASDGKTLVRNIYGWNEVANVIFLESPAGVGFSYSDTVSKYDETGDKSSADDAYTFLVNWLERFPHYKHRDLFIAGESYAGHYVPQLAFTILQNNNTNINLKGIAIGNAWIDDVTNNWGLFDYFWSHAVNSDETNEALHANCNFTNMSSISKECGNFVSKALEEVGNIDIYNIYAPLCDKAAPQNLTDDDDSKKSSGSRSMVGPRTGHPFLYLKTDDVDVFKQLPIYDPCSDYYVYAYLNLPEVQTALHTKSIKWSPCRDYNWTDTPTSILPTIKYLISKNIRLWVYSGDLDGRVPITSTRYSLKALHLPLETAWRPWYINKEVGGYVAGYEGLTLITVRQAGHMVPSYQPKRALTMISAFLQGIPPPSKPDQ